MKILFITDNFPPEVNAPATRTYEHCLEWAELGAEITVITCTPNFPHGKVYEGYRNRFFSVEMMGKIRVIRVWTFIAANEGFTLRILDYMSFALTSFIAGLFLKTDIIIATSPQFFTTFAACSLSKLKRKPWVFELRDLWPESIKALGAMHESRIYKLLEKIEIFLYRNASTIVALTEAFKKKLITRGIRASKIRIITNGSNLDLFQPVEKDKVICDRLNINGNFTVGYIGTHGMAHNLEFILTSIEKIKGKGISFLFIGDGAKKQDAVKIAREKNLRNVIFLDPIPKKEIPSYMSVLDASLVPLMKSDTFKTVIPSKIFEAAAMRKPIILGVEGQAKEIVEGYNAGICFEPENEADFIDKLMKLKEDPELYRELQAGCARLAADFDRKKLAKEMYQHLEVTVYKAVQNSNLGNM